MHRRHFTFLFLCICARKLERLLAVCLVLWYDITAVLFGIRVFCDCIWFISLFIYLLFMFVIWLLFFSHIFSCVMIYFICVWIFYAIINTIYAIDYAVLGVCVSANGVKRLYSRHRGVDKSNIAQIIPGLFNHHNNHIHMEIVLELMDLAQCAVLFR